MRSYNKFSNRLFVCVLLALVMLFGVSAATWDEMKENGAVSDGGIRLGDARDGIVSDVSERNGDNGVIGDIITDASDLIDDGLGGIGGTDNGGMMHGADGGTDNMLGDNGPAGTSAPDTSRTANDTAGNTAGSTDGTEKGGMSMGIIIAILVVIAVIVVIFLLLPKKK